jgi:hypothetical protein
MLESYKTHPKSPVKEIFMSLSLYLILPISSLVISFLLYKKSWSKYLFMLFGLYFGFTFIIPSSKIVESYDSEFYALELKEYHYYDLSFWELVNGFYSVETAQTDIYQPIVTWVVSCFTDNYHFLFAIYGFVFSIFLAKIIWLMIGLEDIKLKGFAFFLLLTFILVNPLWNINGVRMWTALNVFLFGILLFFFKNKKKGLLYISLSCLFHVSFLIPVLFLFIYFLVHKINSYYFFVLFLISFIFKGIPPSLLIDLSVFLPDFIRYKLDFYTDPNTVSLVGESLKSASIFILASQFAQSLIPFLCIVFMNVFYKNQINNNKKYLFFYKFLLFTIFWVNMSTIIPSFGRFQTIYLMLSLFFFFINLSQLKKLPYFNILKSLLFPFFIIIIVQKLREFIDFQSVYIFMGNFLTYFSASDPEPLVNFLLK